MKLHCKTYKHRDCARPQLVLLHGWGMHGGLWQPLLPALCQTATVTVVDLPGHGGSPAAPFDGQPGDGLLSTWADVLQQQIARPVAVLGWSLGALLALRWAQRWPDSVTRLILIAATPCFQQREDWPHAVPARVLSEFIQQLHVSPEATMKRFIGLQVSGGINERRQLVRLRQLYDAGMAQLPALQQGLQILQDCDLRAELPLLPQPVHLISGSRDGLTPAPAAEFMQQQLPEAQLTVIDQAAHVPFLSHTEDCHSLITESIHG